MSCNGRRHDYPRSIVTDHYLLDHHTGGKPGQWDDGPANNSISKCTTSVHILPLAFPCTLAMTAR